MCSIFTFAMWFSELVHQVPAAAAAGRGIADLVRLRAGERDQLLDVFHRKRRMHDDDVRTAAEQRDRLVILDRVVRHFFVERGVDRELAGQREHECIAVGRRFRRELHADVSVRAAAIVDDHLLLHALSHVLHEGANDRVRAAAGRIRQDHPDRFGGEGLGVSWDAGQCGTYDCDAASYFHALLGFYFKMGPGLRQDDVGSSFRTARGAK
jgi:hypothetical protein